LDQLTRGFSIKGTFTVLVSSQLVVQPTLDGGGVPPLATVKVYGFRKVVGFDDCFVEVRFGHIQKLKDLFAAHQGWTAKVGD
jgi:hypothetical protein